MKIDVIENLESKYNTSYDNKNIVNEILKICYDEKNNRIAPKRTLSYIEKNNENLYKLIKENTDLLKVGEIIKYFIYNIIIIFFICFRSTSNIIPIWFVNNFN